MFYSQTYKFCRIFAIAKLPHSHMYWPPVTDSTRAQSKKAAFLLKKMCVFINLALFNESLWKWCNKTFLNIHELFQIADNLFCNAIKEVWCQV